MNLYIYKKGNNDLSYAEENLKSDYRIWSNEVRLP
jgi:hypothetical protein